MATSKFYIMVSLVIVACPEAPGPTPELRALASSSFWRGGKPLAETAEAKNGFCHLSAADHLSGGLSICRLLKFPAELPWNILLFESEVNMMP